MGWFSDEPFLEVYSDVAQEVDCADEDLEREKREEPFVEISRYLSDDWRAKCRGVHLVKSAFWNIEDSLFLIDVDAAALPALDDLDALLTVRKRVYHRQRAPYFFRGWGQSHFRSRLLRPGISIVEYSTPRPRRMFSCNSGNRRPTGPDTPVGIRPNGGETGSAGCIPAEAIATGMIASGASQGRVRYPLSRRSISITS